jgi:membrane associated rhomboid family serine protease
MSIWQEIKTNFRNGTNLTKLLYINGAVFIIIKILDVIATLSSHPLLVGSILGYLAVPAYLPLLAERFWTPLTYMFLHEGLFHLIFNLLWLYWLGKIFLQYLDQRKLVAVYLLGGLSGALFYIGFFNIFPVFSGVLSESVALGASASVMAVVVAIAVWVPEYEIHFLLLGRIRLKYLALIVFLVTSIFDFSVNTGGKIAHIGGAMFGFIYAVSLRKGLDLGKGINSVLDFFVTIFRPGKRMKVTYKATKPPKDDRDYNAVKAENQAAINAILDKISKGGYDSLTKEEKERLFSESQRRK